MSNSPLSRRLNSSNPTLFSAYCIIAAFGTYFCMYAFRKPFTAATYEGITWLGIGFKTVLISSQVAGYTISKFIGIRVVSELPTRYCGISILALIGIAEATLLLFAITPAPWSFVWLFVNGLPLGMVFGLVLRFLEGREVTEALSAGLCASFIVSSGFVKSVGRTLIVDYGVSQDWMPFLTGLIFVAPLLLCVWMLTQIPPPSEADQKSRSKRTTMDSGQRKAFFRRHRFGIIGLLIIYVFLTIVRSLRDDFAVEIWQELGVSDTPDVFAKSEFWVMLGVIFIMGMTIVIRNNRTAFLCSMGLLGIGFVIMVLSVTGQILGWLSPMAFMVLLGLGMYIPYVAYHTTVFERMFAAFKETGTIGYLMYLADAVGYLGYVGVMVFRNITGSQINFLGLLVAISLSVAVLSTVVTIVLGIYYAEAIPREKGTSV